jgi:hypothetical protein
MLREPIEAKRKGTSFSLELDPLGVPSDLLRE